MIDPLEALGLASNVVQFVQFTSNLIHNAVAIHRYSAGCTTDILTLDTLYGQLNDINTRLKSSYDNASGYLNGQGWDYTRDVTSCRKLSLLCKSDCEKLLKLVGELKIQDGPQARWKSFRAALKMEWKKENIEGLEQRLHKTQTTMTLHICNITRLQCHQSAKLDQMMAMRSCLSQRVEQVKRQNSLPSIGEINSLEQQLSSLSLSHEAVAEEQAVLQSLSFESRPVRHTSIPNAHQKTFGWVYKLGEDVPDSAKYITKWLRSDDGLFWVSGKPGSGKLTFMKFIADEPKTLNLLSKWSGSKRAIIASHYF
ncbi:hypothetical protein AUP68_17916 [Ilyonectria robusta]